MANYTQAMSADDLAGGRGEVIHTTHATDTIPRYQNAEVLAVGPVADTRAFLAKRQLDIYITEQTRMRTQEF